MYTELICTPESFRSCDCSRVRWLDRETDYVLASALWPAEAPLSRGGWEEAHEQGYSYCAIVEGGTAAALGAVWRYSKDRWEVAAIYTVPPVRRRGYATAVVCFLTAHILDSGRIATCTTEPDNTAMIRTAEGVGFKKA